MISKGRQQIMDTSTKNKIIFINGVFDVLHVGHINFLLYCNHLKEVHGYELWVGLDSDKKIKKDKGIFRPIFSFQERWEALSSLCVKKKNPIKRGLYDAKVVDFIVTFDTNKELEDIIKDLSPKIMVKGENWRGFVVGEKFCKDIRYYPNVTKEYKANISSSGIINKIEQKVIARIKEQYPGANL